MSSPLRSAAMLLLFVGQVAGAATIDERLAMPFASDLVGSRTGRHFAWVIERAGTHEIWTSDGEAGRRIAAYPDDDGEALYDLSFAADGHHLAYVRGGDAEFPDSALPNPAHLPAPPRQLVHIVATEGGGDRIVGEGQQPTFSPDGRWIAFTRGGELMLACADRPLPPRALATTRGTIASLNWSPDGKHLLFIVDRGSHSLAAVADVADGRITFVDPAFGHDSEPIFSPDGRHMAFIRAVEPDPAGQSEHGSLWSIHVADSDGTKPRTLWQAPSGPGAAWAPTRGRNLFWTYDGRLIFPWEQTGWRHVYALSLERGAPIDLTPGAFEVSELELAGEHQLLTVSNHGDAERLHIWQTDLESGATVRMTGGSGSEVAPAYSGQATAVIATDARHPAYPAIIAPGRLQPLVDAEVDYAASGNDVQPQTLTFAAADGSPIHAQLFQPRGTTGAHHPAVIFVHGGPHRQMLPGFHPMDYYSNAYSLNQQLASDGFIVLSVNYRGGTGYGHDFREAAGTAAHGGSEYADVRAAALLLARRKDVDPRRIGIWGGSWGGYLTTMALTHDPALFASGVDLEGDVDLTPDSEGDPNALSPSAREAALATAWRSSPASMFAAWQAPVLVIHGDDDLNVAFDQSVMLTRMLTLRGIPHEELVFPDERHTFLRHQNWVAALTAAERFLVRTLH